MTFDQPGTCLIDANQAGDATYQAAPASPAVGDGAEPEAVARRADHVHVRTADARSPTTTYQVTATGGGSRNPVTFRIDSTSTSVCSISRATVTFNRAGTCTIDANQAGNAEYQTAPQAQQTATDQQIPQTITIASTPPTDAVPGGTYPVTATAAGRATRCFTIDSATVSVCTVKGSTVTFDEPGTCTIDANQAGERRLPGRPAGPQTVTVNK